MNRKIILHILFFSIALSICGQGVNYQFLKNLYLNDNANSISAIAQDPDGMMWIGTNGGLYNYDGFHFTKATKQTQSRINSLMLLSDSTLCMGMDNGLEIFDFKNNNLLSISSVQHNPKDIRSMIQIDDFIWIGTLSGLYKYNIKEQKFENYPLVIDGMPYSSIYTLCAVADKLYIGTYRGLIVMDFNTQALQNVMMPRETVKERHFINTLFYDKQQNKLWIGTEGGLYNKNMYSFVIEENPEFYHNSIKCLSMDISGDLLIGTDNGMYIFDSKQQTIAHLIHDSRNENSLINNIVWCIFEDKDNNVWIGTDYNISFASYDKNKEVIYVSEITNRGDGNRFFSLIKDSRNRFWLGGSNGLIMTDDFSNPHHSKWFQLGKRETGIPHNRVRDIFEDSQSNIYIATDGGLCRYDDKTQKFTNYAIVDKNSSRNANWAYSVVEDKFGNLWVSTFMGGVFVLDKTKLLASNGNYEADKNLSIQDGLRTNNVTQLEIDSDGNIWMLYYEEGLGKVDPKTFAVEFYDLKGANNILVDGDYLWVVVKKDLIRLNILTNKLEEVQLDDFITSILVHGDVILTTTATSITSIDKKTMEIAEVIRSGVQINKGYYDADNQMILWGGNDLITWMNDSTLMAQYNLDIDIFLTDLHINNRPYYTLDEFGSIGDIRFLDHLQLSSNQDYLTFYISDFNYSNTKNQFVYKLEGHDKEWSSLDNNLIQYDEVQPGKYQLVIRERYPDGSVSKDKLNFGIIMSPPFYKTLWAKLFYAICLIAFLWWMINYFRVRNILRKERIEKSYNQRMSQMKMNFFTEVSHDIKTPLSLIIAPLSVLIAETKDTYKKNQLKAIQSNALRINSMIKIVVDYNRNDSTLDKFEPSPIEFVSFAKSIFQSFEQTNNNKEISFAFESEVDTLYVSLDVLKIESIMNNILSNALKYTDEGFIKLEITYDIDRADLCIILQDSGIGIPPDEIAKVTNRFYQSSKTVHQKEGSGIGLYLVKKYVEDHNGQLFIQSEEKAGTIIEIHLPVVNTEIEIEPFDNKQKIGSSAEYKICILEDNLEISNLIYQSLKDIYQCEIFDDGSKCLAYCAKNTVDLILTDVMMPQMDGLTFVKRLKKSPLTNTIPVIVLTAKDDKRTENDFLKIEVDAFIAKPFDIEFLRLKISQLLNKRIQVAKQIKINEIVHTENKMTEIESADERFLVSISNIIEDKIDDSSFNVSTLSEISNIGAKQIYRKLKQLTGYSPVEYIRIIRLKKAKILLQQQKFNISEVMYMVGFSDYSYFSKSFKAIYGMTPKEYLEQSKNDDEIDC